MGKRHHSRAETPPPRPADRPLSRGRRRVFYLVGWLVPFALLLVVEMLVRLCLPPISPFLVITSWQGKLADDQRVTIFRADPLLCWALQPDLKNVRWDFTLVTTNTHGYRLDTAIAPKAANSFRVVCIGDSVTFGYRVPTVFPDHPDSYDRTALPYPELLRDWLQTANPDRSIDVVPLAVPGYSSRQGLLWARRDLAALHPDVVVIYFGYNDCCLQAQPDTVTLPDGGPTVLLRTLMLQSQLITRAVVVARQHRTPTTAPLVERVDADQFAVNILDMAQVATRCGAYPLIIGPVCQNATSMPGVAAAMRKHRDTLRAAATAANVPYLEIPELMEGAAPDNLKLFGETIHPNQLGHRLMAQRILQTLGVCLERQGIRVPAP